MQAISADLTEEQKRQDQLYYRKVEIAKLYWHVGNAKYEWDSLENIDAYVKKVSTAKWKLDTRTFNEWKSPSFQVEVDNRRNYWSELETGGIWQTGTNEPYVPELTKIRVRCGQYLPDGTEEDKYVFSGLINKPLAFHDKTPQTATISCVGYDEKLRRTNAELLSTLVTDEVLGADAGTVFTTANNGVGGVPPIVKKGVTGPGPGAATTLKAGTDYTLSDTNLKTTPLKVTLAVDLGAGNTLWCTYRYWYQDKGLSWIVEELLKLAGITTYNVDTTVFALDIENTWPQTTKVDWDAYASRSHTENDSSPGDVSLWGYDYVAGVAKPFTGEYECDQVPAGAAPAWTIATDGGYSQTIAASVLRVSRPGAPNGSKYNAYISNPYNSTRASILKVRAKTEALPYGGYDFGNFGMWIFNGSYYVGFEMNWSSLYNQLYYRDHNGWTDTIATENPPQFHTYELVLYPNGTYKFWIDGSLKENRSANVSAQNKVSFTCDIQVRTEDQSESLGTTVAGAYFDYVYYGQIYNSGNIVSQVLDTGVGNPTSWGLLDISETEPGVTLIGYETISSAASGYPGDGHADWIAIGGTGQIESAVKRYLWVRVNFTGNTNHDVTPTLHGLIVYYYTSSTTIPLVDLTGKNVQQAIQDVAKKPAYEIGFDAIGYYFYRQRTSVGAAVLIIDSKTNLEKEILFNWGTNRILNVVDVTFGSYRTVIDPDTRGEAHPHSKDKFGERRYIVSGTGLLPSENADVATATAETIYDYTVAQKKRAQVQMKFLLQYQLGDVVEYLREHKFGRWRLGDTDRRFGDESDPDFVYYDAAILATWNYNMRIEGIEFDTDPKKMRMKLDLVEIP